MPPTQTPGTAEQGEEAGAIEHYLDPALYDFEYRNRRADLNFYRLLADERHSCGSPSPALELACGSGRLTVPLLKAGHAVVGFDRASAMLQVARNRVARLPAVRRNNCLLFKADMRNFSLKPRVSFAVAAFHSLQHLVTDADVLACLGNVHSSLKPDGWFTFDVLPPHPHWLSETTLTRWSPRTFTHPITKQLLRYGTTHTYDSERKALHMRLHYQPVTAQGATLGAERVVRLCHRQFWPGDLDRLLDQAGFEVLARYSDFNINAVETAESLLAKREEHIYIARPKRC